MANIKNAFRTTFVSPMVDFRFFAMRFSLLFAGTFLIAASGQAIAGNTIAVEKSHAKRIALSSQAGSVIVGNPDIADVTIVDSYTIYVVGRSYGSSSVTVTDRMGRAIYDGDVVVSAPSQGSVNLYSGKDVQLVLCNQTCVAQDVSAGSVGQAISSPPATNFQNVENGNIVGLNPVP
jgi:hypothetical protein